MNDADAGAPRSEPRHDSTMSHPLALKNVPAPEARPRATHPPRNSSACSTVLGLADIVNLHTAFGCSKTARIPWLRDEQLYASFVRARSGDALENRNFCP